MSFPLKQRMFEQNTKCLKIHLNVWILENFMKPVFWRPVSFFCLAENFSGLQRLRERGPSTKIVIVAFLKKLSVIASSRAILRHIQSINSLHFYAIALSSCLPRPA